MRKTSARCLPSSLPRIKAGGNNLEQIRQNYYGNLCTKMYEILHKEAPADELDFIFLMQKKEKRFWNLCAEADVFLSLS